MRLALIEFAYPDLKIVIHFSHAPGVLQLHLGNKAVQKPVEFFDFTFRAGGSWPRVQLLDAQFCTGPAKRSADVLGAVVNENSVWQSVLLDGFPETVKDTE